MVKPYVAAADTPQQRRAKSVLMMRLPLHAHPVLQSARGSLLL
jgi:hypothetical protein